MSSCASDVVAVMTVVRRSFRILRETLPALLGMIVLATTARGAPAVQIATAQITGPPSTVRPHGEFGFRFAVPVPTDQVSDSELGMNGGLTMTTMMNPVFGVGLDFGYHYWPASSAFRSEFNSHVRRSSSHLLELGGTSWRFSAFQAAMHVRFTAPLGRLRPWFAMGPSVYWVDPNVRGIFDVDGVYHDVKVFKGIAVFGYSSSLGFDVATSPGARLGLQGSYDYLSSHGDLGSNFGAWSIGGHVLFGR
jgi:hypothetical protein